MNNAANHHAMSKQDTIAISVGFGLVAAVLLFFVIKGSQTRQDTASTDSKPSVTSSEPSLPVISMNDLRGTLTSGSSDVILDLRSDAEFSMSHAVGSVNVASSEQLNGVKAPDSGTVLLISSGDSAKDRDASDVLARNGIPHAFIPQDLAGWLQAGGSVITAPNPSSPVDRSKVTFVNADTWKSKLAQKDIAYRIIDIRSAEASGKDQVPGALNIPYAELEKRRGEIPVATNMLLCADNADNAFNGGVHLFDLGFFSVRTLKGSCTDIAK